MDRYHGKPLQVEKMLCENNLFMLKPYAYGKLCFLSWCWDVTATEKQPYAEAGWCLKSLKSSGLMRYSMVILLLECRYSLCWTCLTRGVSIIRFVMFSTDSFEMKRIFFKDNDSHKAQMQNPKPTRQSSNYEEKKKQEDIYSLHLHVFYLAAALIQSDLHISHLKQLSSWGLRAFLVQWLNSGSLAVMGF